MKLKTALSITTIAFLGLIAASTEIHAAAIPQKSIVVRDIEGKRCNLFGARQNLIVLVFIAHDCPISNAYAPEINRIAAQYAKRKVDFLVVYADSDFSAASAREHMRQYSYRVPAILDTSHRISSLAGATATPEAVLLAHDGHRLYLGRIDNRYATWGKTRSQTTQHDLRDALDAALAGKPVPHPFTRAIGCFIPAETK